jgi:hypothetical protein
MSQTVSDIGIAARGPLPHADSLNRLESAINQQVALSYLLTLVIQQTDSTITDGQLLAGIVELNDATGGRLRDAYDDLHTHQRKAWLS